MKKGIEAIVDIIFIDITVRLTNYSLGCYFII